MSSGQGLGAVGGALIGFWTSGFNLLGAAKGAYWGYMAGSIVDPPPGPHTEGPRLNDRVVQTSEEGAPLPTVYGTARLAGNVIWSSGLEEIATTEEQGGGSGGGGATSTTYTYKTDAAVAICAGEITGVRRIWADAKLVYDISETASINSLMASYTKFADIRIYTGTESQLADPLIQATEGAANAPAFRGMAYVVFEDLQLADYGNRLPNFSFEVVKDGDFTQTYLLDSLTISDPWVNVGVGGALYHYDAVERQAYYILPTRDTRVFPGADGARIYSIKINDLDLGAITERELIYSDDWGPGSGISDSFISGGKLDQPGVLNPYIELPTYTGPTTYYAISDGYYYSNNIGGRTKHAILANTIPAIIVFSAPFALNTSTASRAWGCGASTEYVYFGVTRSAGTVRCIIKYTKNGDYIDSYDNASMTSFAVVADDEIYIVVGNNLYVTSDFGVTLVFFADISGYITRSVGNAKWELLKVSEHFVLIHTETISPDTFKLGLFTNKLKKLSSNTEALNTVAGNIISASGLSAAQYDVSALASDVVRGYTLGRPMTGRSALEPLQTAYHFDLSERDGKIYAIKRGAASVITLADDDLGAAETPDGVKVKLTRHNETELPSEIQISYSDIENDHQAGTQYARALTAQVTNIQQISLPLAMTATEAAQLADIILNAARYTGRHTLEFALSYEYARLAPADVVSLPAYGVQWTARIGQVDMGMPGLVQCTASPEIAALYASIVTGGDPAGIGQTIGLTGTTSLTLLDCCMLRDTDTTLGWYAALTGSVDTWPGGAAFKSSDSGATWTLAASATRTQSAKVGSATTVLPNADTRIWDKTSRLNVRLTGDAALSSATETAVLNGANAALVGAHGRWELIQWLTATLEIDGTYTLSDLLRGRKGTEHAAASHAIGDAFVVPEESTMRQIAVSTNELNAARQYKAITTGQLIESVDAVSATYTGERLKPLAPVLFTAAMQPSKNVNLKWQRRDRVARAWASAGNLPQSEDAESYEIDVIIDGAVVRTLTSSTTSLTYTSAEVAADTLGLAETATFNLYQISASLGRGHVAAQSLVLPGYTVTPQISTITLGGTFVVGDHWVSYIQPVQSTQIIYGQRVAISGDTNLSGVASAWVTDIIANLGAKSSTTTVVSVGNVITIIGDYEFILAAYFNNANMSVYTTQTASDIVTGARHVWSFVPLGGGTWGPGSPPAGDIHTISFVNRFSDDAKIIVSAITTSSNNFDGLLYPVLAALQSNLELQSEFSFNMVFETTPGINYGKASYITATAKNNGYAPYVIASSSSNPSKYLSIGSITAGRDAITAPRPQISGARIYQITPTTGSLFTLTLNSTSFTYTTAPGDDQSDIGAGLVTLINAGAEPITAAGAVAGTAYDITLTADVANTAFTLAGTSSAGGTLAIATTQDYALS